MYYRAVLPLSRCCDTASMHQIAKVHWRWRDDVSLSLYGYRGGLIEKPWEHVRVIYQLFQDSAYKTQL